VVGGEKGSSLGKKNVKIHKVEKNMHVNFISSGKNGTGVNRCYIE
jgi:hypothetical protein